MILYALFLSEYLLIYPSHIQNLRYENIVLPHAMLTDILELYILKINQELVTFIDKNLNYTTISKLFL